MALIASPGASNESVKVESAASAGHFAYVDPEEVIRRRARTVRWTVGTTWPPFAGAVFIVLPMRDPGFVHNVRFGLGVALLVALLVAALLTYSERYASLSSALVVAAFTTAPLSAIVWSYEPTVFGLLPFLMLAAAFFVGFLLTTARALGLIVLVSVVVLLYSLLVIHDEPVKVVGIPIFMLALIGCFSVGGAFLRRRDERTLMGQARAIEDANSRLETQVQARTEELSSSLSRLRTEMAEHQAARSALTEAQEILVSLLDHVNGIVYRRRHDSTWTCSYVSGRLSSICGPPSTASPGSCRLLERIPIEQRKRVNAELASKARHGATYNVSYQLESREGLIWVRDRGRFYDGGDGALMLEGLIMDITYERGIEDELHATQRMDALGRMAGGIAHDFNNLMTVVVSCVEPLIQSHIFDDSEKTDLEEIRAAAGRASELTKRLLAFARKQQVELRPIGLSSVIQSIQPLMARLAGPGVSLTYELQSGGSYVRANVSLVEQILINLVVNAREAMDDQGTLHVATRVVIPEPDTGPAIEWVVQDSGPGMMTEVQQKAFEPFFTTKANLGSGLGLSTVHGIVAQLGGSVSVTSEKGEGCRFRILLPTVPAPTDEVAAYPLEASTGDPSVSGEHGGEATLLVVDDEEPVRRVTSRILRRAGYRVLEASGATEALNISRSVPGPIDLLITDVVMADGNGPDLALRLCRVRNETRVLFTSGYAEPSSGSDFNVPAASHILQKPFASEELRRRVREALDVESRERV